MESNVIEKEISVTSVEITSEVSVEGSEASQEVPVFGGREMYKGDKGDKGDPGETGPQGEQGPQGPAGADGASILQVMSPMYAGSFTYESVSYPYRMSIATIEEEAGQTPKVGDFLLYNSALWPISLILDDTVYMQTNLSIKGATGERGNSILKVTTMPTSVSTTIDSVTYNYRSTVANVKNQSGTTPKVGDIILYGYYLYKVECIYNSYVYSKTRTSIRGATGDKGNTGETGPQGEQGPAGHTPVKGTDYFTEADTAEMVSAVIDALPVYDGEVVAE